MKIKYPFREEKTPLIVVKVSKSFKTIPKTTKRTIIVGEAFGIGLSKQEFKVLDNVAFEINPGDIVYITGESGGGKSTLLKEIERKLRRSKEFRQILNMAELSISEDEILIHGIGKDAYEAMKLLNYVGLGEAFLYVRRFKELSDGQRYRYMLAKALFSGAKTIIMDEFLATLDRITAKVVAYLTQKIARKMGLTIIAASTHEDIIQDLNPDLLIVKRFGTDIEITRREPKPQPFSLANKITLREARYGELKPLLRFHYRGSERFPYSKAYGLFLDEKPVGCIFYSPPTLEARRKKIFTKEFLSDKQLLNKYLRRISRVVIHPIFRGLGLGTRLYKETLPICGAPFVEAISVMASFHPASIRGGMVEVER